MKISPVAQAIIAIGMVQGSFMVLWLLQGGVNKLISYTPQAKNWENCIQPYLPSRYATSTEYPPKWQEPCGGSPYLSIMPN